MTALALKSAQAESHGGLVAELRALRIALEALEAKILPFDVPKAAHNFLAPTMRDWVNSVISHIAYQYGVSPADLVGPARTAACSSSTRAGRRLPVREPHPRVVSLALRPLARPPAPRC